MRSILDRQTDEPRSGGSAYVHASKRPSLEVNSEELKDKKYQFELALLETEEDKVLKNLVRHRDARYPKGGPLNQMLVELRAFEKMFLVKDKNFFNNKKQSEFLNNIFSATMNKVVQSWPQLQAENVDWYQLYGAIHAHMMKFAGIFNLQEEMQEAAQDWSETYQRERLNKSALEGHQQVAYLSSKSADKKVIDKIRGEINQIDEQLDLLQLPSMKNAPAFSEWNPEIRANLKTKFGKNVPSAWTRLPEATPDQPTTLRQMPVKEEVKPAVTGWRSWAKKIPGVGRWF